LSDYRAVYSASRGWVSHMQIKYDKGIRKQVFADVIYGQHPTSDYIGPRSSQLTCEICSVLAKKVFITFTSFLVHQGYM